MLCAASGWAVVDAVLGKSGDLSWTESAGKYIASFPLPPEPIGISGWEQLSPTPRASSEFLSGSLNGTFYTVLDSGDPRQVQTNVWSFDGADNWTAVEGPPYFTNSFRAVGNLVYAGHLYLIGGNFMWNSSTRTNVWRFDGSSWEAIAGLPEARCWPAVTPLGDYLYVLGGAIGGDPTSTSRHRTNVWRFAGESWEQVNGLTDKFVGHRAAAVGTNIYILATGSNVWRFDGENYEKIGYTPTILDNYSGLGAFANQLWYYRGGGSGGTNMWSSYDGITWSQAPAPAATLHRNQFVTHNNHLYIVGGYDGKTNMWRGINIYP